MRILILFFLFSEMVCAQEFNDKMLHFYAGAGISYVSGSLIYKYTDRPGLSCVAGMAASVGAGLAKEYIWDKQYNHGDFSQKDYLVTGIGAVFGAVILRFVIDVREDRPKPGHYKWKRNAEKEYITYH